MKDGQVRSYQNRTPSRWVEFPKVELHRHLEGAVRLETLMELAPAVGLEAPSTRDEARDQFLITAPMRDLGSVLNKFLASQKILSSEEIISRITFEAIEDAANEGIRILELRFAPTFIEQGHSLSRNQILRAVRKGLSYAKDLPIAVGFLCIIQRTLSPLIAEDILELALENRDLFVGLDLADNEVDADPRLFETVFGKAAAAEFPVTVHAGEADFPQASLNVKNSIEILGARRIGHGLQVIGDPFVMNLLKTKALPLELCVTSNWLTNAVPSLTTHPIRKLMEAGVPVTINSDDPGLFGIDLVHEYDLLNRFYGFSELEFNHCNDVAAQASFIPLLKKKKFWPRPIHSLR
jgi:adenosine deaminase